MKPVKAHKASSDGEDRNEVGREHAAREQVWLPTKVLDVQSPAHAQAISYQWGGGEAVDRVIHQESDQGRSGVLVCRSDVVGSYGFI